MRKTGEHFVIYSTRDDHGKSITMPFIINR